MGERIHHFRVHIEERVVHASTVVVGRDVAALWQAAAMPRVMSMFADLPPAIRRILIGISLNAAGGGLTLSLLMVYLTQIRGIPVSTAGLILAWESVVGLVAIGPVGSLIDRFGPVHLMLPTIVLQAVGVACWSFVHSVPAAFLVATATSITGTTIWPSQNTLLAQLGDPERRDRVFGLSFMFLNLGFGVGGLVSALVVRDGDISRFEWLYRIDGLTYLALAVAVLGVRTHAQAVHAEIDRSEDVGGYGEVLRDRRVWLLLIGGIVMFTCGYGALNSGIPVFATTEAHLSVRWLGVIFGANTFVIVALQPVILGWVQGRSRAGIASLVGVVWAASWIVTGAATVALPVLALCAAQVLFATGEALWAPVGPTLVNAMAPDRLRGRYNAVVGLQWGISGVLGPAITGAMLGQGLGTWWWRTMALGCLAGAALLLLLRGALDPVTDGRMAQSPS